MMQAKRLYTYLEKHNRSISLVILPILIFLVAGVYTLVYMTGGIKYVYSHSMYIPILLSGFVFGVRGGILVGLLGGIVLGPFMPIDVATGEPQALHNWLYRTGFFILFGLLAGAASDSCIAYIRHIKWLSRHDYSTKLANGYVLSEQLKKIFEDANTSDDYILALVSIENKTELLSTFGSGIIDKAITQYVKLLQELKPGYISIFRTDSAQISVLLRHMTAAKSEYYINKISSIFQKSIEFEGIPTHIDARIGSVFLTNYRYLSHEHHIQMAHTALAVACNMVRDHVAYDDKLYKANKENIAILGELQQAFKKNQLSLHHQPKVTISTGAVHGAEALIRWNHPVKGNIPPGKFIPRAEESTLINTITDFALQQAMSQMAVWQQQCINIPIAVNISTRNLLQPNFTSHIINLLKHYGLSGEQLELEVTEGALMMDIEKSIKELDKLASANITIAIDDFGTGFSSLQYLHRLPISYIKIDQSFVRRLPNDKSAISIVESAVKMAHQMEVKSIAEGVENREIYDFLANIGCDMAQGFLISRPMPADEYSKWHTQNNGCFR